MGAGGGWGAPEVLQIIGGMAGRTGHHGRHLVLVRNGASDTLVLIPLPEPDMRLLFSAGPMHLWRP